MGTKRRSDLLEGTGQHVCALCGYSSPRWFGRCHDCGQWSSARTDEIADAVEVTSLVDAGEAPERFSCGIAELDRVLGGGLVPGAVLLLAGEPGIGKSTLVLQLIDALLRSGSRSLLVTGEESIEQVSLRGGRLGVARDLFRVAAASSLDAVVAACSAEEPDVMVVDSIQTLGDPSLDHSPGSLMQVRACATALVQHAKRSGVTVVLVGHVTKDGDVAGPKALEHIVDVVLVLEGERSGSLRVLRSTKNRFGSCDEVGVFVMSQTGLQAVVDPSAMLLEDRRSEVSGSVVFPSLEGSRPLLVEIQALTSSADKSVSPKRVALGIDARRLDVLLGVLAKRAHVSLSGHDVVVAAAGGLAVREPAVDLALCLALFSARNELPVEPQAVAIGEVGLAGEVRRVRGLDKRLAEAARLGFTTAVVPPGGVLAPTGVEVIAVAHVRDALAVAGRRRAA